MIKLIRTIKGITNLSRFLSECDESKNRFIPRPIDLPQGRFSYSEDCCLEHWQGKSIVRVERVHAVYDIYEVTT